MLQGNYLGDAGAIVWDGEGFDKAIMIFSGVGQQHCIGVYF